MLAVDRDNRRLFLHEPRMGMAVPLLVDLDDASMDVAVPDTADLENNFARVNGIEDIKASLPESGALIDELVDFSKFYSRQFEKEISDRRTTIASLRNMVARHFAQQSAKARHVGRSPRAAAAGHAIDALALFES